jgi:crossover junction endodeoxyribonuclease RuvC
MASLKARVPASRISRTGRLRHQRANISRTVAIEKLYFARNVTTGLAVAQARGVVALAACQAKLPIGEFSALEVKSAVVGYGKATKRQVQEMIKILLNLDDLPRPDDAADALGVAICQIHAGATLAAREK